MILKKLTSDHPDVPALKELYEEAFPENERTLSMAAGTGAPVPELYKRD